MTAVFVKGKKKIGDTCTCIYTPRNTKEGWQTMRNQHGADTSSELSKELIPANCLILDFQAPELGYNFCFSHLVCGTLLQQPQQTNIPCYPISLTVHFLVCSSYPETEAAQLYIFILRQGAKPGTGKWRVQLEWYYAHFPPKHS